MAPPAAAGHGEGERRDGEREGEEAEPTAARVGAEEECATLREAVVAAQFTASELRAEVEKEHLASANAASKAMAMMLRLQREKAEVQMELRQPMAVRPTRAPMRLACPSC